MTSATWLRREQCCWWRRVGRSCRLIIALASALSICPAAWSMLKVLPTCAGVSTSAPAASSESGFAEAMRVVGLHLEEMNRRQAAQELAASHRDATIIETILQLKQQMGGRLTRWRSRRGRWRMPTIVEAQ
eukprot:jgi/Astpho2/7727/Aster-02599